MPVRALDEADAIRTAIRAYEDTAGKKVPPAVRDRLLRERAASGDRSWKDWLAIIPGLVLLSEHHK